MTVSNLPIDGRQAAGLAPAMARQCDIVDPAQAGQIARPHFSEMSSKSASEKLETSTRGLLPRIAAATPTPGDVPPRFSPPLKPLPARSGFLSVVSILVILFCINKAQAQSKAMGEPVPGAEVYIELETDDEPIIKGKTDHIGTYHFKNLKSATYKVVCKLPKTFDSKAKKTELTKAQKLYVNFTIEGIHKSPITFGSKTGKSPLLFESPDFILKEKLNSFTVVVSTSVNNYGINDDGIK